MRKLLVTYGNWSKREFLFELKQTSTQTSLRALTQGVERAGERASGGKSLYQLEQASVRSTLRALPQGVERARSGGLQARVWIWPCGVGFTLCAVVPITTCLQTHTLLFSFLPTTQLSELSFHRASSLPFNATNVIKYKYPFGDTYFLYVNCEHVSVTVPFNKY